MPNPLAQFYRVKQYRPDFFKGFDNEVIEASEKRLGAHAAAAFG